MHDDRAADDRIAAVQLEHPIVFVDGGDTLGVRLDIAQVADVPLASCPEHRGASFGIPVTARRFALGLSERSPN